MTFPVRTVSRWAQLELLLTLLVLAGQLYAAVRASVGPAHGYRLVGEVPVGRSGWVFRLYQSTDFEAATALTYELYHRGRRRTEPTFLVGTHDWAEPADFQAGQCGPVLYLAYIDADSSRAGALYDVRWRPGYYDSLRYNSGLAQEYQLKRRLLQQARRCNSRLALL